MAPRGAQGKGAGALQRAFERHERALLWCVAVPVVLAYAWAVVSAALFPVVPYCVPPASLASDQCGVLGTAPATGSLAAGCAVAGVGAVLALLVLAAPGSWSLHSAKNKAAALAALVAAAAAAVQLAGAAVRRGIAVNYAQVDAARTFFTFGSGPSVTVALNASLYAPGTRVALSVRDLGGNISDDTASTPAPADFDMIAPLTSSGITVEPGGVAPVDNATLSWTLDGLADGHRYLFALVPATPGAAGGTTAVLHPQVAVLRGSPLETLLRSAGCPALRNLADVRYVDMRLFHACRWAAATATCTPLGTSLPESRCSFSP